MTTLYFETHGTGKDLVLLHGWGFNSIVWQPILDRLSSNFRVTLIDLPGASRSITDKPYQSMESLCEAILAIAPKQAYYLGWSFGVTLALYLNFYYPNRVIKCIGTAGTPRFIFTPNWPGVTETALQAIQHQVNLDAEDYLSTFIPQLLKNTHLPAIEKNDLANIIKENRTINTNQLQSQLVLLRDIDLRENLRKNTQPICFILGEQDRLIPAAISETLINFPHTQVHCMPGVQHVPFLSEPDYFITLLRDFIDA